MNRKPKSSTPKKADNFTPLKNTRSGVLIKFESSGGHVRNIDLKYTLSGTRNLILNKKTTGKPLFLFKYQKRRGKRCDTRTYAIILIKKKKNCK